MKTCVFYRRIIRNGDNAPILGVSLGYNGQGPYLEYANDVVNPIGLRLYEFEQASYLIYWPGHFIPDALEPHPRELTEPDLFRQLGSTWNMGLGRNDRHSTPGLLCAWSDSGFVVAVQGNPDFRAFLKELYEAFCQGQGCTHVIKLTMGYTLCLFPNTLTVVGMETPDLLDH